MSFGSGIGGLIGRLGPLSAALTGVAGAGGLGLLVKSSFAALDSLGKTADSIGFTTEALAGLRRSAERSGVASEKLDKGLARMQRTISTAFARGGAAAENFDQLGLSLEHVRSLAPEEQFFTIADSIAQISDVTDRTRIAMETFGRDGTQILKILGRGADAARGELAKAAELGLAPSRAEIAKIEAANDAIADMKDSFKGIANTVAINVAPAVQSAAEKVMEWGIAARNAFNTAKEFALDAAVVIGFAWENMGSIGLLLWEKLKLAVVSWFEDVKDVFLVKWPAIFTWFANNWQDILWTALDYTLTIFENLGKNIRLLWQGVLDFISGKGFNVDFHSLEEGFRNSISELPDIGERELTELEKRLAANIDRIGGQLSMDLGETFLAARGGMPEPPDVPGIGEDIAESITNKMDELQGAKAVERGSAEAFSQIFAAMRGDSSQDKQLKVSENALKEQKKQTKATQDLASRPTVELVPGTV